MSYKVFVYILLAMFAYGLILPSHIEMDRKGEGNYFVVLACAALAPVCIGIHGGIALEKMKKG